MSNAQDNTAIVAITIALIAFFVTTAQLLQALFGTAEGYRRCQSSVIGGWATKTKRKWRWSEFRFETIFTTPDIHLALIEQPNQTRETLIEGTRTSRMKTYSADGAFWRGLGYSETEHDLVNWLSFLNMLYYLQSFHFWDDYIRRCTSSPAP